MMLSVSFALFNQPSAVLAPTQQLQLACSYDDYTNELSSQDRYGPVIPDVNRFLRGAGPNAVLFLQADFIDMFSLFWQSR